jgi:hypothetical protein
VTIWALTSYFNPRRFQRRYQNFQRFRETLGLPLLTVQWEMDGAFELGPGDSDLLISLAGGDLMWQKERLLNLALGELPAACDAVAWLDCDVVFEDDRWIGNLDDALAEAPVVQLFAEVAHPDPAGGALPLLVRESLAAAWARRGAAGLVGRLHTAGGSREPGESEAVERLRLAQRPSSGHAWAARRDVLHADGFYDACIWGVGDMAIALAAIGHPELFLEAFPHNPHQATHYRSWADRFAAATGGRVGCLPARLHHLFHGNLEDRQYRTRLQRLAESGFDPAKDLVLDGRGLWHWRSGFRALEQGMRDYFDRRCEDAPVR